MSVWYLEPEDEITDAVSRLRAAHDDRVVLVVPPGSRIGTGRINFRLLAREAEARERTITLVSGDPQVRAMASAAGLTAFASVGEAEKAAAALERAAAVQGNGTEPEAAASVAAGSGALATAAGIGVTATATTVPEAPPSVADRLRGKVKGQTGTTQTYAMTPRAASAALNGSGAVGDAGTLGQELSRPKPATQWRRRAAGWGVRATALGALAMGGLYVAYLALPTAAITLRPNTQEHRLEIPISANPEYLAPNASARVIPARQIPFPLSDGDEFATTGEQQVEVAATGTVRFISKNTVAPGGVIIPEGTVVSTVSGSQRFKTTEPARIARYRGAGRIPTVDVPIIALRKGRDGNVPARSIRVIRDANVAESLAADLSGGGVFNPERTSGGGIERLPYVTDADYKAARTELRERLERRLAASLAEPDILPGTTLYPDSANLGNVTYQPELEDLSEAERRVSEFSLTANTNASALTVEDQVVTNTAIDAFRIGLPPGTTVVPDTIAADPTSLEGVWNPETGSIDFDTEVVGQSWGQIDEAQLREQVKGRTVSEAQSILSAYGSADVKVWPDFLPFLPDDARRIELTIPTPEGASP
jgi:hypothetical protein